jgi:hypothetical protein
VNIPDLSTDAVLASLKNKLQYIEDERVRERDYLLDWYEGVNIDQYVRSYFGSETLKQIPILSQNITRRVSALRSMTYKRPPRMRASDAYTDAIDVESLNSNRRLLERLTFLLGTMAIRSKWNELTGKIEYETLSQFMPLFLAGDSRDKPVGICYPIEYQGNARINKPMHSVWTEDRPGYPGQHYLLNEGGKVVSVPGNEENINPYGVLPVTFTHRYPPIRDFHSVANAIDVAQVDLAVNVAQVELQLAIRYGCLGIKVLSGVDDASRVEIGTDKVLYIPEGADFKVTNSGGSLQDIVDSTRFLVESTLNNNHIRAKYARDDAGNAPSAASLSILEMEARDIATGEKEDTWRPWENRRYAVDKAIIKTETGADVGPDYSVDFLEPNYALTPDTEISLWTWRFEQGLATKQDYFDYLNPDASPIQREEFRAQQEEITQAEEPQNRLLARLEG